tara:strand:+ start:3162 stop:6437 length:3276 start_codon:yes stop_codon:yes gene_type:complete
MASYGVIRRTIIKGQAGTTWYVHLYKKDYTGVQVPMELSGEGFDVKWSGSGGTRDRRFINSECSLNFIVQNNDDESLLYDIFEKGDRNYFVRVYKNYERDDKIWWFGWVNPSFSTIENSPFPYKSKISSTDSIGTFKKQPEADLTTAQYNDTSWVNYHIYQFGATMGLMQNWLTSFVDNKYFDSNQSSYDNPWVMTSPQVWSITSGKAVSTSGQGYMSQDGVSITQGETISLSFTILDKEFDYGYVRISLRTESGLELLGGAYTNIPNNGIYVWTGVAPQSSTGIRFQTTTGGQAYSITNVKLVKGTLDEAPIPCKQPFFKTSVDWWRQGDTDQTQDPFYLYRTGRTLFRKDAENFPSKYSKYDVLDGTLKVFNTVGVLSDGRYNFIQPNQYADNTSGDLLVHSYAEGDYPNPSVNSSTTPSTENHLLTLDGTTNSDKGAILGGSTLTYEPPFKAVSATFLNSTASIYIPGIVDFTNYGFVGNVQQDLVSDGNLSLNFNLTHKEKLLASEVASGLTTGYDLANKAFKTDFTWNVKLTDGTQTKYLKHNSSAPWFSWETTEPDNQKSVGLWTLFSNTNGDGGDSDTNPCKITHNAGDTYYTASTSYTLATNQVPLPPFTGSISLKLTGVNTYSQWFPNSEDVGNYNGDYASFNNSLLTTIVHSNYYGAAWGSLSSITDTDSIALNEEANGIRYTSSNDDTVSEELFDFKNIIIGTTGSISNSVNNPTQANVQYLDSNNEEISATGGFREGNSGSYFNITQLLCNEFLSLQAEPLEILQAEIFSPDISPLKLLKYSINDDTDFKYYSFLGGSFGAQSETMKGEWFKANSTTTITYQEEEHQGHNRSLSDSNEVQVNRLSNLESTLTNENAIGLLVSDIDPGVSFSKFNIDGVSLCKVYDNQNLILRNPYNEEYTIVVVDGDQAKGVSGIDIDALTLNIGFPIGSTLSVLTYDLSNVITGGSSTASPQTDKIDITSAQYQALGSSPITLIVAPGSGKVIIPISTYIYARRTTTETSSVDLYLGDTTSTNSGSYYTYIRDFMNNETGDRTYIAPPSKGEIAQGTLANRRLQLYSNGTLNGDIELTVYITYQIMDI